MSPLPALDGQQSSNLPVREDWLAQWHEDILEPNLPIVDPHHHLWDRPGWRYLLDELLADLDSGHNVLATVVVPCRAMYRRDRAAGVGKSAATPLSASVHGSSPCSRRICVRPAAGFAASGTSPLGTRIPPS